MEHRLQIEGRKTTRSRVRMKGRIRHLNQETDGRIYNISRTGIGIELLGQLHVARGSNVIIQTDDIGLIEGTVRWAYGGYLGIQINQSSNSLAQMSAYFRNYHQEVRPVLVR
ncbi:PilZ domain-containing protein [Rhizobium sp. S95]|uniref:PilZ domain-containing protein n=1 Tax=Ciceribacter sichuanensis TaxID=2949647 RepID=A0AAJ1BTP6_9HYPH|nr:MULTISPECIES: PilZ domain-containing protein [unclassified Ciceribacter]MCM2397523.1 PilZ domain-containing protein [Ciceribacter sp. S95]MCM2399858.1 PilZ domain-containing protein [Ciceribacter sp. S153]MCO5956172.1 PilZ domain-containing protein [Ciceribacter sp. S101]